MPEDDWLDRDPLRQLIHELTDDIAARYRIGWSDAEQMVHEAFAANRQLRVAAGAETSPAKLKRTRVFKQAASELKRKIYYQLRTYRIDDTRLAGLIDDLRQPPAEAPWSQRARTIDGILESHASTRERLAHREEFYERLMALARPPRYVLDVGCGVQPLMFPFEAAWAGGLEQYWALDNNGRDVECVAAFGNQRGGEQLVALRWDLSEGWGGVLRRAACAEFDLALLMKLVPVVQRQHRELLPVLHQTPAADWLLTGSRCSLTKRVSIERREKRALQEFVRQAGREVKHEFTVGEEFAWLVARREA